MSLKGPPLPADICCSSNQEVELIGPHPWTWARPVTCIEFQAMQFQAKFEDSLVTSTFVLLAMLLKVHVTRPCEEGDNLKQYEGELRTAASNDHHEPIEQLLTSFQPCKSVLQSTLGLKACDSESRDYYSRFTPWIPWARPDCTWDTISPFENIHSVAPSAGAGPDHIGESFKTWKSPNKTRQVTLASFILLPYLSI